VQIIKENIDELNAILKVQVKKEDYEPKIETSLNNYRKKVDMKGFRKGQVPKGIVKKMYGNHIMADTVNDLLSESINKFIIDNKIDVLGHPLPKTEQQFSIDINDIKDFEFEYEIGLAPAFEINFFKVAGTIEREVPECTDKMIDEEVERIKMRFGKPEEVETIEDKDVVNIKLQELDAEGNLVVGGIENTTPISADMLTNKKFADKFKKLKKGESIEIDVFTEFGKDEASVAKQILGTDFASLNGALPKFKATVEGVKRITPAEIDETLIQTMYGGASDVKNEADLRVKIKEDVEQYFDRQADAKFYNYLAENLIEKTEIALPDDFLKRWIKATNEKPITDEQIENDYEGFRKNLKWSLIIKKVGGENNIKVTADEVKAKTAEQIKAQMLSYGIPNISDEETEKFVASMMAREDHVNQTKETILEEKMFDYFKSQAKIKDKKVSLEEFNKKQ
jgi:trigger factor